MANGRHSTNLGEVQLPRTASSPLREVGRRVGFAVSLVVFVALIVLLGRDGYVDDTGDQIGFLDSLYYASVTVTTTGYGDITAVSDGARLATIALITPARIVFLILVVGTTVEVLTDESGIARSVREAPEIDGVIHVGQDVPVGEFSTVEIVDALGPDLVAAGGVADEVVT